MARIEKLIFGPDDGLIDEVIHVIEQAEEKIRVCMFWFDCKAIADSLIDAFQSGIELEVIVDARSLRPMVDERGAMRRGWSVPMYLAQEDIPVFIYEAEDHILHHKFVLLDPHANGSRVLLSSFNWHHEDLLYNYDTAMVIKDLGIIQKLDRWFDGEIAKLRRVTLEEARGRTGAEIRLRNMKSLQASVRSLVRSPLRAVKRLSLAGNLSKSKTDDDCGGTLQPPSIKDLSACNIKLYLSDSANLKDRLITFLSESKNEVLVMHSIVNWMGLANALRPVVNSGGRICVIGNMISNDCRLGLGELGARVIRFRPHGRVRKMHHKVICIDRKIVLWGSVNLFPRSLENDRELLLVLDSENVAKIFASYYEALWQTRENTGRKGGGTEDGTGRKST